MQETSCSRRRIRASSIRRRSNSPTAALALRVGALGRYKQLTNGRHEAVWEYAGTLADEYKNADFLTDRVDVDQRIIDPANGIISGQTATYAVVTQSRGFVRDAIGAMEKYLPDSTACIGELWAELAFIEMTLADNFCNGIPLGHTIAGVQTFGDPLTDAAGLRQRVRPSRLRAGVDECDRCGNASASTTTRALLKATNSRRQGQFRRGGRGCRQRADDLPVHHDVLIDGRRNATASGRSSTPSPA